MYSRIGPKKPVQLESGGSNRPSSLSLRRRWSPSSKRHHRPVPSDARGRAHEPHPPQLEQSPRSMVARGLEEVENGHIHVATHHHPPADSTPHWQRESKPRARWAQLSPQPRDFSVSQLPKLRHRVDEGYEDVGPEMAFLAFENSPSEHLHKRMASNIGLQVAQASLVVLTYGKGHRMMFQDACSWTVTSCTARLSPSRCPLIFAARHEVLALSSSEPSVLLFLRRGSF